MELLTDLFQGFQAILIGHRLPIGKVVFCPADVYFNAVLGNLAFFMHGSFRSNTFVTIPLDESYYSSSPLSPQGSDIRIQMLTV